MTSFDKKRKFIAELQNNSVLNLFDDYKPNLGVDTHSWKPDITIRDLKKDLSEASSPHKMFTLLGVHYIQEDNPQRYEKLLAAAKSLKEPLFARRPNAYMTDDLYMILEVALKQGKVHPYKYWMHLLDVSRCGL